jgi:hypothetical protein
MEIAKQRNERLVVVDAGPGGSKEDLSVTDVQDAERIDGDGVKTTGCVTRRTDIGGCTT